MIESVIDALCHFGLNAAVIFTADFKDGEASVCCVVLNLWP